MVLLYTKVVSTEVFSTLYENVGVTLTWEFPKNLGPFVGFQANKVMVFWESFLRILTLWKLQARGSVKQKALRCWDWRPQLLFSGRRSVTDEAPLAHVRWSSDVALPAMQLSLVSVAYG